MGAAEQTGDRVAAVAAAFTGAVDAGELELPESHRARWAVLARIAADDLCVARLAEAHLDALGILAELGQEPPPPGSRWGVWAAHPPSPALTAAETPAGWVLTGTKPWCSGARVCTHALVTADAPDGYRLFAVRLAGTATPRPGSWPAVGMAGSDSLAVDLDGPAEPVGGPGDYLDRPGFWHGALAVAGCWHGGAVGLARALLERTSLGPHALAHLGAVDADLTGLAAAFEAAAADYDAGRPVGEARALQVRAQAERVATAVLDRVGRALGAGPLCQDARHAQLAADLPVYLRQSHAEADLARLGELVRQTGPRWR